MTTLIYPAKSFDAYAGAQNDATLTRLWESGFRVAQHYYSHTPGKNLTRESAVQLTVKGFWIGVVWETTGQPNGGQAGASDAQEAVKQVLAVGQPPGSGIAFAVDFDPTEAQIVDEILPYFTTAATVVRERGYKIGAYGCGDVHNALFQNKCSDYDWLAGALGWAGSRNYISPFDPSGKPAITQGLEETIDGLDIDPDTVYLPSAGLFQVSV